MAVSNGVPALPLFHFPSSRRSAFLPVAAPSRVAPQLFIGPSIRAAKLTKTNGVLSGSEERVMPLRDKVDAFIQHTVFLFNRMKRKTTKSADHVTMDTLREKGQEILFNGELEGDIFIYEYRNSLWLAEYRAMLNGKPAGKDIPAEGEHFEFLEVIRRVTAEQALKLCIEWFVPLPLLQRLAKENPVRKAML